MLNRRRLPLIATISLAGFFNSPFAGPSALAQAAPTPVQSGNGAEVLRLASRIGIGPSELLTAGASPADAAQVVANIHNWRIAHGSTLVLAEEALRTASREEASAKALVRRDPNTANRAALTSAVNSLAATANHLKAILDDAALNAVAGLPEQVRSSLVNIRAASSVQVPEYLKVVSRSAEEWVALRDAVERSSSRLSSGQPAHAEDATLLTNAEANPLVVAAKQRLESLDQGVRAAFEAAISALP